MTDDNEKTGGGSGPLAALSGVGQSLAEALKGSSALAFLALLALVAGIVLIAADLAVAGFVLFVVLLVFLAWLGIRGTGPSPPALSRGSPPTVITPHTRDLVVRALANVRREVARTLDVPLESVRANVFTPDESNLLRILDGLTSNMTDPTELTISMPVGEGSTGRAFQHGRPNFALFLTDWGQDQLVDHELRKVHPDLRWVISIPLLAGTPPHPCWVLNVDGLRERPTLAKLRGTSEQLLYWCQVVTWLLTHDS